jgi:hypothetical protein
VRCGPSPPFHRRRAQPGRKSEHTASPCPHGGVFTTHGLYACLSGGRGAWRPVEGTSAHAEGATA